MSVELAVEIYREALRTAALVGAPILGIAMMVGITVSIMQTITSINEQTLTFVPKILAIALTVGIAMPWMLGHLTRFLTLVLTQAPGLVLMR
jgi:flagellar biosynthetic protein FliQ